MDNALVLIAEDEPRILDILLAYFERAGFRTVAASDGDTAIQHHHRLNPDIVILDVKLPGRDGNAVLAEIRRHADTPIIMATAMGEDVEKLAALHAGADDYVVKPFNPLEIVARAKAVLRRASGRPILRTLRAGPLEIDREGHVVRLIGDAGNATTLDLTPTEFRLLSHLAAAPRRVFTRGDLLDACLPATSDPLERTVDSHVSNLRRKLVVDEGPDLIVAVRGVGYRLLAS